MKAHELAKKLLEGPDLLVTYFNEDVGICCVDELVLDRVASDWDANNFVSSRESELNVGEQFIELT